MNARRRNLLRQVVPPVLALLLVAALTHRVDDPAPTSPGRTTNTSTEVTK